jgi:uncharacterized protein (TIGR02996 family)
MTTEAAFLQDICENPDDDVPRLVYADWLGDRGGPDDAERADFIRVQCALAHLEENDPARDGLERRERELLWPRLAAWWNELPEWARQESLVGPERSFRRGFLSVVACTARAFIERGGELLQRFPVQSVQLMEMNEQARALASCPHLARITSLALIGPLDVAAGIWLRVSPHFRRLACLDLSGCGFGDVTAGDIASSEQFPSLRELDMEECGVSDAGAEMLAGSARLAGLTVLVLGGNNITDAGARYLASSPCLGRLEYLDLTRNPITAQGGELLRQRFGAAVLLPR